MEDSIKGDKSEQLNCLEFEDKTEVARVSKAEQWVTTLVIYYCHLSFVSFKFDAIQPKIHEAVRFVYTFIYCRTPQYFVRREFQHRF